MQSLNPLHIFSPLPVQGRKIEAVLMKTVTDLMAAMQLRGTLADPSPPARRFAC